MTPPPRRPPRPAAPARYSRRAVPGWRRRGAQGPAGRVEPQLLPQVVLRHGRHRGTAAPPPGGARRSSRFAFAAKTGPGSPLAGGGGTEVTHGGGRHGGGNGNVSGNGGAALRPGQLLPGSDPLRSPAPSRLGPAPEPRSLPARTRLSPAPELPRSARRFARPWPVPGTRSPSDPRTELTAQRSGDEAALLSVRDFIVKQQRDTPAHTWLHFLGTEVLGCSLVG